MGFLVQMAQAHHAGYNNAIVNEMVHGAQRIIDDANTYATNTVGEANAYAGNTVRAAQNAYRTATAALANQQRSLRNRTRAEVGAKKQESIQSSMLRVADATLRGGMESRIRASEQLGALQAQAAAAGMGGGSVEALKSVTNVQAAYVDQVARKNADYQTYEFLQQQAGVAYDTIMSQDLGQSFAEIDYAENTYTPVINPIRMGDFAPDAEEAAMWSLSSSNAWGGAAQQIGSVWGQSGQSQRTGTGEGFSFSVNNNGAYAGNYNTTSGFTARDDMGFSSFSGSSGGSTSGQGMFGNYSGTTGLFGGSTANSSGVQTDNTLGLF